MPWAKDDLKSEILKRILKPLSGVRGGEEIA